MRIFGLSTRASAYLSIGYDYMDMDSSTGEYNVCAIRASSLTEACSG